MLALQDGIAVAPKIYAQGRVRGSCSYRLLNVYELNERLIPVITERKRHGANIHHNDQAPHRKFDLTMYEERAEGDLLLCNSAMVESMAQRYFLF